MTTTSLAQKKAIKSAYDKYRYQQKRAEIRAQQQLYRETHREEIKAMNKAYHARKKAEKEQAVFDKYGGEK